MAEQHVKLLQELGVPQEKIDEVEKLTPDQLKEWKPDGITETVRAALKTTLLNDQGFLNEIPEEKIPEATKKKIESGQYTRFQNEILETAKKQLGLEDTDLADLSEADRKSIKKTVAKIAEKYLGKKGGIEGSKQLQQQVTKLTEDLEKKDADWQLKFDNELKAVNGSASAKLLKYVARNELATLDKIKLSVPAAYLVDPMLAKLQSKYALVLNASDEIELKNKENPVLDAMEGGKIITFKQALKNLVLADKVGAEEKEEEGGGGDGNRRKKVVIGEGGNEGGNDIQGVPSYIEEKIKKNTEMEAKNK